MLLLESVIGLRRKLNEKLENGKRRTRVLMSNLWLDGKVGEENAGILRSLIVLNQTKLKRG